MSLYSRLFEGQPGPEDWRTDRVEKMMKGSDKGHALKRSTTKKLEKIVSAASPHEIEHFRVSSGKLRALRSKNPESHPMSGIEKPHEHTYKLHTGGKSYHLQKQDGPGDHWWHLSDNDTGSHLGEFSIRPHSTHGEVKFSRLLASQGTGIGKKAYTALAHHYGGLKSDASSTSDSARNVYKSLGRSGWARPIEAKNKHGQERWEIRPHNVKKAAERLKQAKRV